MKNLKIVLLKKGYSNLSSTNYYLLCLDEKAHVPWYKKVVLWICGIDHRVANDRLNTGKLKKLTEHQSLYEKPAHSRLVNTFAVIITSVVVFVIFFYK